MPSGLPTGLPILGLVVVVIHADVFALRAEETPTTRPDSRPMILHKTTMGGYGNDYVRMSLPRA